MESLINKKLSRMREYLGYLEDLRVTPLETFMTDFKRALLRSQDHKAYFWIAIIHPCVRVF